MKTLVAALLLVSCASSSGGSGVTVPEARADQALVVFYRPKSPTGAAIRFRITDGGGVSVGDLTNGTMLHEYVAPGSKTYAVSAPSVDGRDMLTLDLAAGSTTFIRGAVRLGWPAGRPKFTRMNEADARGEIARL